MAGFKVLIIEDDRFISDMYMHTLEKEGFDVTVVVNGPEGLEKLRSNEYQVGLLDLMIPDKTGTEVLNDLKPDRANGDLKTKIIVMTNFNMDDKTREVLEDMADGYLIKADITPSELVHIVTGIQQQLEA